MRLIGGIVILAMLSACAAKKDFVDCSGPVVLLNPGHWQPTDAERQAMAAIPEGSNKR